MNAYDDLFSFLFFCSSGVKGANSTPCPPPRAPDTLATPLVPLTVFGNSFQIEFQHFIFSGLIFLCQVYETLTHNALVVNAKLDTAVPYICTVQ